MLATESVHRACGDPDDRKPLGAWATPDDLVAMVVERTITPRTVERRADRPVRVVDLACGDGRFLVAAADRIADLGGTSVLTGIDIDPRAIVAARAQLGERAELEVADALDHLYGDRRFDVVVGNPPFLSQLATATTRGGASRLGGGAYADAAAEFLALAVELAEGDGGRIGLVLPQSILASRDAGPLRDRVDALATRCWSWWSPRRHFDADVLVCALGFERHAHGADVAPHDGGWTTVVLDALGVPALPALDTDGVVGVRCGGNVNFRDEYYGLVPAVADDAAGPPLVTSGLIDPGRCRWGERRVRFARRTFEAPRVDVARLDARMQAWATRKLVPKVLVANQTRVVEAVADEYGEWLPGVPVTTLTPRRDVSPWQIAAVLTAPVAAAQVWHRAAGTGLSARSIRVGPALLRSVSWPAGSLDIAVGALRDGDVVACGAAVDHAYGVDSDVLLRWWRDALRR